MPGLMPGRQWTAVRKCKGKRHCAAPTSVKSTVTVTAAQRVRCPQGIAVSAAHYIGLGLLAGSSGPFTHAHAVDDHTETSTPLAV